MEHQHGRGDTGAGAARRAVCTVQPLWKTVRWSPKKSDMKLAYDPEIPPLGAHPRETRTCVHADAHEGVHRGGLPSPAAPPATARPHQVCTNEMAAPIPSSPQLSREL